MALLSGSFCFATWTREPPSAQPRPPFMRYPCYRDNWGGDGLHVGDIRALSGADIPDCELSTASFPCTDLSLAGHRKGLQGEQSGLGLDFLRILAEMASSQHRLLTGPVTLETSLASRTQPRWLMSKRTR